MRRIFPYALGALVFAIASACGGGPQVAPQPNADSIAAAEAARRRADSLAAAQRMRDSLERVRAAEEERVRRMREDSVAMARRATEEVRATLMTRIHFDFDKSDIRPGDAQVLDQKLAILQANPNLRIEIVGHCDERGSDEYNLALGNRRALAAKQYLVSRGIAADRITTRSMGEEQPLAMGSTEEAWAQNRRDEFAIVSGGDVLRRPGM
ncbi:MAG TPA: peptidoglycan-associated lipoprotein Pal [Gemmatimonadales bacterium]|nr:peptidoglycan-associated lipoprotein Pal [Gemmatimonadales bacterium]